MQAKELRIPNQWGDHSRGTHQLPHLWPLILTLTTSAQNPCFYQKIVTQSPVFFHTVQNFGNCSLKTPNRPKKRYPNSPYFCGFCHWKTPNFLPCMQVFEGNVAPSNTVRSLKFCILETESCNLVNTFMCKFNKGDENKISVLQAQPTQLLWKNFIGGQGWYTGHHTLVKHGRGYILQPSSVWFCPSWFSKQMLSVPEAVRAEAF